MPTVVIIFFLRQVKIYTTIFYNFNFIFIRSSNSQIIVDGCPNTLPTNTFSGYSISAGCVVVDTVISTYQKALFRCKLVTWKKKINWTLYKRMLLGPQGRLIEIMNAEDQELAVNLTKAAETNIEDCDNSYCLSYWWSGLVLLKSKDQTWKWIDSIHITRLAVDRVNSWINSSL